MERLLNAKQMKACDDRAIRRIGIPSAVLMERAALSVVEEMKRDGMDLSHVLVVCGAGNNGGDGFAIARLLKEEGSAGVTIAFVGKEESMTEETALQRKICENLGLKVSSNFMDGEYTVIVDAIFGIGLSRTVEGHYADVICWINAQNAKVAAVDIPSGVSADDGRVYGVCVKADLTVTFACRKIGQILYPGAKYCGQLVCRNIGILTDRWFAADLDCCEDISADRTKRLPVYTYTERDLDMLPQREPYSNKGTYGKVLLIAGSEGMSGAAVLAARAAFRSGCGMVRVFTPVCNRAILQTALPEAMVSVWDPDEPEESTKKRLAAALAWPDVIGIGPGLGLSRMADVMLDMVLEQYEKPLVIDADALNLLAKRSGLIYRDAKCGSLSCRDDLQSRNIILTPHIGEMARLTGKGCEEIASNLAASVSDYAVNQGVICVLKDARTAVSDGKEIYLNTSGNHGMAVAGSGDVLTGIICGLLAQNVPCFHAATLGVYLHGLAGDLAIKELGAHGMMAGDIADQVGVILRDCSG